MNKTFPAMALCVLAVAFVSSCDTIASRMLIEHRTVANGELRGLEIGESKTAVLEKIRALGSKDIRVVPRERTVVTFENIEAISKIIASRGIRISSDRSLGVDVYLGVDERIESLVRTVPAEQARWLAQDISPGMSRAELEATLRKLVRREERLFIQAVGSREQRYAIPLDGLHGRSLNALLDGEVWTFSLTPSDTAPNGEFFELTFDTNRLAIIHYRRPRLQIN